MDYALLIMVRNEAGHAVKTLDSARDAAAIVLHDTGSTDATIVEVRAWCAEHHKPLYLLERPFVDFAQSRNALLAFADAHTTCDFYLLMDASDELRIDPNVSSLRTVLATVPDAPEGFYCTQEWQFAVDTVRYYNCRLIRARRGWYYRGVVHEFITKDPEPTFFSLADRIVLYQDRRNDGGKSLPRFERDYTLLRETLRANAETDGGVVARNVFYLARTCSALGKADEAIEWFRRRTTMGCFQEEVFESFLSLGSLCQQKGQKQDAVDAFLKAIEAGAGKRAEPLVELGAIYVGANEWHVAFLFLQAAVALETPREGEVLLFVNLRHYRFLRWHLMGICAYYVGAINAGREACERAIQGAQTDEERQNNESNLKFYLRARGAD